MREEDGATRLGTEGAVTHGNGNSSGGTVAAAAAPVKKAPKQLPAPNSDFYQLADVLTAEEKAIVKKVRTYMETKVQPIINKYWSDDAFPFELLPSFKELGLGGLGYRGLWLRRRKPEAVRLRRDGAGARRRFVLHVLRRAQRPGDGLDLSRRIGGAEAEVAAADGALGKRSAASASPSRWWVRERAEG